MRWDVLRKPFGESWLPFLSQSCDLLWGLICSPNGICAACGSRKALAFSSETLFSSVYEWLIMQDPTKETGNNLGRPENKRPT